MHSIAAEVKDRIDQRIRGYW